MKVATAAFSDDGKLDDNFALAVHFDPKIGVFGAISLELFVGETKIRRARLNGNGFDLLRQRNQGIGKNDVHDFVTSNSTSSILASIKAIKNSKGAGE